MFALDKAIKDARNQWMLKACQRVGCLFIIDQFCSAAGNRHVGAFPAFQEHFAFVCVSIKRDGSRHFSLFRVLEYMLDDVASLADVDSRKWTMQYECWRESQAATGKAAALPETHRCLTVGTAAAIIGGTAVTATLRTAAILVSTILTDVAL